MAVPGPCRALRSAATASQGSSLREEITTLAPCSAIRSAIALPMPREDPVMIATSGATLSDDATAEAMVRGVAYLICEFDYDETAFPSGLPNVSAVIRGAKLYDPRTATTAWSENPALMVRHVLTHPQFGKRASITAAEDARITAAANVCDTYAVYTVAFWPTARARKPGWPPGKAAPGW